MRRFGTHWLFFLVLFAPLHLWAQQFYIDPFDSIGGRHASLTQEVLFYDSMATKAGTTIRPMLDMAWGGTSGDWINRSVALAGFDFRSHFHPKWRVKLAALGAWVGRSSPLAQYAPQTMPYLSYARPGLDESLVGQRVTGELSFSPAKYFSFSAGHGTHHWGPGYRSLILGQQAPAMPFLRIDSEFWNLHYTNLFIQLRDVSGGKRFSQSRKKYAALHALSWQVAPSFNVTFYEAVIWQDRDTLSTRNFEFNYLNPIIFYRPIEFAQGSADNVLLGIGLDWEFQKARKVYAQVVIDEFLLSELRDRSGWWANKFAIQLGAKLTGFPKKNWTTIVEGNLARPFTYSHGSSLQAFGHINQPLAHPLGANFYESIAAMQYRKGKLSATFQLTVSMYGRDVGEANLGGDIFRSYASPAKIYDNFIGQGEKTNLYQFHADLAYEVLAEKGLWAWSRLGYRHLASQSETAEQPWVELGVRMNLQRPVVDF